MRIAHCCVIEMSTGNRVFAHCRQYKAEEFITKQTNPENYRIVYKWVSI